MIELEWRVTRYGQDIIPNSGTCFDGPMPIGGVRLEKNAWRGDAWSWSMTASGHGASEMLTHGEAPTKDDAKAALDRCYRNLLAAHPGNRDFNLERNARTKYAADAWERRGERPA